MLAFRQWRPTSSSMQIAPCWKGVSLQQRRNSQANTDTGKEASASQGISELE
uniref:Uncharacterized protein n=1 Tax=Anguilla anguilla TaxID=7936 RepID=A0A0E9V4N5_ANGAN